MKKLKKYFDKKNYENGEIISKLIIDLDKEKKFKNILFVRTPTTGSWLDNILPDDKRVKRVLYDTKKLENYFYHKSTIIINCKELGLFLQNNNTKYDLICIDPFHEYKYSLRDFKELNLYLKKEGILLSHDCCPPSKLMSSPTFIEGGWCGETYKAFVKNALKNPKLYYCILNIDTGIGIISKEKIYFLSNNLNKNKQKEMFALEKEDVYDFFVKNSKEIINLINL